MGPYNEDLPDLNYFTCTLDEAAELNSRKPHQYETINEFIDFQALHNGTLPAVAFPPGGAAGSTTDVFSEQNAPLFELVESGTDLISVYGSSLWFRCRCS
jgi:hypothetical protein